MKKLVVLSILLFPSLSYANDKDLMIGQFSSKQSLFLFRDIQGLDLNISEKEKSASLSAAHDFGGGNILSAKVTGKFDGTDTNFATEEGLTNDVTLKVSFTKLIYNASDYNISNLAGEMLTAIKPLRQAYRKCMAQFIKVDDGENIDDAISKLKKDQQPHYLYLTNNSCANEHRALVKQDSKVTKFQFAKEYWFIKNEVTYSPGNFKYYDTNDLSFKTQSKEALGFGASFGYFDVPSSAEQKLWNARRFKFGFSFNKADSAEPSNRKRNICSPLGDSDTLTECFDAYLEPAIEKRTFVFNTSYAMTFKPTWFLKGFEIDVKLTEVDKRFLDDTKDNETERWSVSLPFTFFVTEKYDFKAGLSVLWQEKLASDPTDFDRLTAGLFITKGFDISSL